MLQKDYVRYYLIYRYIKHVLQSLVFWQNLKKKNMRIL